MEDNNKIINTDWMKMDKLTEKANYSDGRRYAKLDDNAASQISSVLQFMTSSAAGNALSGAYRVEFPKGLSGVLVPHNGGSLAIMRDPVTKEFLAQGTLFSLSELGAMYSVFSALSMATGQYFMRQINENLRELQTKLDQVLDFLYNDKACELYAQAKMVFSIYRNCASIMHCTEQRIAALQTVQQAKIFAERNIQFYYRDMNKLASKRESMDKLINDLNNYTQAVSIYGVCAVMEIVLSQNYDEDFLKYIEDDLKRHVEKHHEEVGQLKGIISTYPKSAAVPLISQPKPDPRQKELLQIIEDLLGKDSPVKGYTEIISQMRADYTNKSEYHITAEGAVYKCK